MFFQKIRCLVLAFSCEHFTVSSITKVRESLPCPGLFHARISLHDRWRKYANRCLVPAFSCAHITASSIAKVRESLPCPGPFMRAYDRMIDGESARIVALSWPFHARTSLYDRWQKCANRCLVLAFFMRTYDRMIDGESARIVALSWPISCARMIV